jgi:hypothetical protein
MNANVFQLYKPYSKIGLLGILRRETSTYSVPHLFLSGLPTVFAYHVCDWVAFLTETIVEGMFYQDENGPSEQQVRTQQRIQTG